MPAAPVLSASHNQPVRASGQRTPAALALSAAAYLALLVSVGLQAPAKSVGLRWTPGPPSRTLRLPPVEPLAMDWPPLAGEPDTRWREWLLWALATLLVAAIAVAIRRWLQRRNQRPTSTAVRLGGDTATASGEANARTLESGLVAAMHLLAEARDPGNAVVQAWQALQDAAAKAGVTRRPAETTTEFTTRILYRSRGAAAPIAELLTLYQRVRFGAHTPSASDIAAAQRALATLVQLWRGDLTERRPTKGKR